VPKPVKGRKKCTSVARGPRAICLPGRDLPRPRADRTADWRASSGTVSRCDPYPRGRLDSRRLNGASSQLAD
jgi:hypothetical protein